MVYPNKMKITAAFIQLGEEPPYNCVKIPVRMIGDRPQVRVGSTWYDFPKNGPRPKIKSYMGRPVAGISTDWELLKDEMSEEWSLLCNDLDENNELTGNAEHARNCYDTPLDAESILDLVVDNLGYYGDPYYYPLTRPVDMKVQEYYDSLPKGPRSSS